MKRDRNNQDSIDKCFRLLDRFDKQRRQREQTMKQDEQSAKQAAVEAREGLMRERMAVYQEGMTNAGFRREDRMEKICSFQAGFREGYDAGVLASRAERPADEEVCECGHPRARHGIGEGMGIRGACFAPSEPGGHLCKCEDYRPAASAEQQPWVEIRDESDLPPIGQLGFWHDKATGEELYGYLTTKGHVLIYSTPGPLKFAPHLFDAFHPKPAPFTPQEAPHE